MMNWWALVLSQAVVMIGEASIRNDKYAEAEAYAMSLAKPLLVVGGPWGSPSNAIMGIPAHGHGDVCLDLDPAACAGANCIVAGDVRSIPYPDDYFGAAFVSHVLEHLATESDARLAIAELERVAERLFVVTPSKFNVRNWLHADHHLWLTERPDGEWEIEERSAA